MKKLATIALLSIVTMTAMAIPARKGPITRVMEDGTETEIYLHGDEHFHYMTNAAGEWLEEETLRPMTAERKEARLNAAIEHKQQRQRRIQEQKESVGDLNLAPRGLVILVNFQDVQFKTYYLDIDSMLNAECYGRHYDYNYRYNGITYKGTVDAYGSARVYFRQNSFGQYDPEFDVVGPVTVSQKMEYYGGNDSNGNDKNPEKMIKEACELANTQFNVDFTQYDNDNDGAADIVYVIYAGYGEADGGEKNTIWPHQYELSYTGTRCYVDGIKIDHYACSNELNHTDKQYAGIGTFCHEFSHVLGLPDLYATNDATHHTLCNWDIMDYGPYNNEGNTPPAYSSYERFYMGWLTPRILTEPAGVVSLGVLNDDNPDALLICEGDEHNMNGLHPSPTTFYMLENRQNLWGWDRHLPGNGMLITKITYNRSKWIGNTVNNSASAMGVDIIEAKANTTSGYYAKAKATDAFPAGATEWTDFEGHEITNIVQNDGLGITFSYRWPAERLPVEDVKAEQKVEKILRNGQVLIIRNGKTYNAQGALVNCDL